MYLPIRERRPLGREELIDIVPEELDLVRDPKADKGEEAYTYCTKQHRIWRFLLGRETTGLQRYFLFAYTGRWERVFGYAGPADAIRFALNTVFRGNKKKQRPCAQPSVDEAA